MRKAYAPILPAPSKGPPGGNPPGWTIPKAKRVAQSKACEPCRQKKVRCDGGRPQCAVCAKHNTECIYRTARVELLEKELQEHRDIFELLKSAPVDDAMDIFHRLRTAETPSSVLSSVEGEMHGHQQNSTDSTADAVSPPNFSGLDFELMIRHPSAYQAMDHLDGSASNLNPLPNQYSPSLLNDPFRLSLEDHSPLVLRPGPDEGGQRGQDGDDRSSPLPRGNQQEQS